MFAAQYPSASRVASHPVGDIERQNTLRGARRAVPMEEILWTFSCDLGVVEMQEENGDDERRMEESHCLLLPLVLFPR